MREPIKTNTNFVGDYDIGDMPRSRSQSDLDSRTQQTSQIQLSQISDLPNLNEDSENEGVKVGTGKTLTGSS